MLATHTCPTCVPLYANYVFVCAGGGGGRGESRGVRIEETFSQALACLRGLVFGAAVRRGAAAAAAQTAAPARGQLGGAAALPRTAGLRSARRLRRVAALSFPPLMSVHTVP